MDITRSAIRQNRVTAVALVLLLMAGLSAYAGLPQAMDPGFKIRVAQIVTLLPGASPERIENLVSDKIEEAVREIPELDFVASTSKPGASIVLVNLKEKYDDLQPIWDDMRRKVEAVVDELPEDIIGPMINDDFGDTFGIVFTVAGDDFTYAEKKEIAEQIRDELLQIDEVAKVQLSGLQEERIFVEYDDARLAQLGLSPIQLQRILESSNIISAGGSVLIESERINIEPTGNFESVEDLGRAIVSIPGEGALYLEDIVEIRRGYVDPASALVRSRGAEAVSIAINLREGGNIVTLGEKVQGVLDRLPESYAHGLDFDLIAFEPTRVSQKVDDFVENVLQSIGIVLAVMLITLGLRTGLLVASLIPMTMLTTLLFMQLFGIGLDQVSLASLIIALGMLVDNAIVMVESIIVHMENGKSAEDAAVRSSQELRIPLLTSSLTTCAAFLPIFLAESAVGEYTNPIFKVVSIALLSSWALALTMVPLLCVAFLRVKRRVNVSDDGADGSSDEASGFDTRFYRGYRRVLIGMLRRRWLSLSAALVAFVVAMMGFGLVPQLFFPAQESKRFTAVLRMPIGTALEETDRVVAEVEEYIEGEMMAAEGKHGVVNWAAFMGEGAPKYELSYNPEPPSPEYALLIVNVDDESVLDESIDQLDRYLRGQFPDLEVKVKGPDSGPPVENPIEVRISGSDTNRVFEIADEVKAKLRSMQGPKTITDNWGSRSKKLMVEVDEMAALRAGVSNQDIAVSMLTNLSGLQTSEYREDDKLIPIVMKSAQAKSTSLGDITSINVFSLQTGQNVPLGQVADTQIDWEPAKVIRRDGLRTVTVQAQLEAGATAAAVNAELVPWLNEQKNGWPLGYRYTLGGENESSGKANASIGEKMPIAGLIILILLVTQFNSLRRTFIILFTIPMALIGVVVGLLAAQSYFGFMTLLGIVSLAGIVINNAIVLLERIKQEIEENGLSADRAVIAAAQQRLRPILLTTATTIGGLLPLYISGGAMWEPMAIAIMFGLAFSTVLTLGVVPVLYSLLFRVRYGKTFRW